jgi:hypothetical protein
LASGGKDWGERVVQNSGGTSASCSVDGVRLAGDLYRFSSEYSKKYDGNVSPYPLAGIPLLVSTIRALLIEANSGMFGLGRDESSLIRLAQDQNEIDLICEKYVGANTEVAVDIALLQEVRNEIVHPSHTPAGTKHNTPTNMLPLRHRGLLQSTGQEERDYTWIAQLQSHRLFRWGFFTIERIAKAVLCQHDSTNAAAHLKCYQEYREHDL